ncbi:MAG TPA: fimbria/pilus outer membrane usher protein, partial [Steroidobacteraceae bacterium]|nr:fimbria/pilus outer membrane usher protein [Steroidobacteraceae bacterium]
LDVPDRLATLRVGDAISTPGAWGRAVRFGGIQFGTNFRTQPTLVTTPLLSAQGEALVPSTVDVFVNQRQVASEQVPPGPFSIDRLPALTGAGQLQVVVTDALGRQQVISQPYYSGSALLQPGLAEYALEIGGLREDYGRRSFAYGDLLGSATYRRGLSDTLTAGTRAEAQAGGAFAVGAEAAWLAGSVGILSGQLATGGDASGAGYLAGFALERNANFVTTYLGTQYATRSFRQLGSTALERTPRQRTFAGLGFDFVRYGNLQFAYALQSYHDSATTTTLGLNYSYSLGALGYLGLFASRATADDSDTSVLLTWTVPLGDRRTASTAIEMDTAPEGRQLTAYASLQRALPSDRGFGYALAVSSDEDQDASLAYQGSAGTATVDYSQRDGAAGVRVGATGAVALTSLGVMPARRLDRSFAVVQVADYEGLTVFLDNQPVGRTDARGRVLVDSLRPYERNEVSVDPVEVPMDGAIDQSVIGVTPAYRSGAVVRFPVTRAHAATLRLVREDGTPVPAGARATLGDATFPVALAGTLYVEGLSEASRIDVRWNGGACSVAVRRPAGQDPLPDLGTLRCR